MAEAIKSKNKVCLTGPKGCGKSFISIIIFYLLQQNNPCIYLGLYSLVSIFAKTYFLQFLEQHKQCINDHKKLIKLFEKEVLSAHILEMIGNIKSDYFLIIELDQLATYEKEIG